MAIVCGLDIHRSQVTYDWVDVDTGEGRRGRLAPANRETFRGWLEQFDGQDVDVVVEGCTGWRFIVEECRAAGVTPHLADPAEASVRIHGVKRRAKTDKVDAKGLRELGEHNRVPESWIPPAQVLEIRTAVRLYHDLMTERAAWLHRIHATLFHQGAVQQKQLLRGDRDRLHDSELLSPAGKDAIKSILRVVEVLDGEINRIRQHLMRFASRQPGCKELQKEYGIGKLTSVVIWSEIGDCRRFSASAEAVRHTGLDVTVYSSNGKRSAPHLSRQGQPLLRWALFEAGRCGGRATSPDHLYWQAAAKRVGKKRAAISVGRKLTRRCHHRLRALGDKAFAEV
jgi:transposase